MPVNRIYCPNETQYRMPISYLKLDVLMKFHLFIEYFSLMSQKFSEEM